MKARVRTFEEGLERGRTQGRRQTLICCMLAFNNAYNWKAGPITKVMLETERLCLEAKDDPDFKFRAERQLKEMGLPLNVAALLFGEEN